MRKLLLLLSLLLLASSVLATRCDQKDYIKENPNLCQEIRFTEYEYNFWKKGMTQEIWKNYPENKAIAFGRSKLVKAAYFCNDLDSLSEAKKCALAGCESYGLACYVGIWNDEELTDEEMKIEKQKANFKLQQKFQPKSSKKKKKKKSVPYNALICPEPFFKAGLIAIAYDENQEILGEALRSGRNDSVLKGELRALSNCRNRGGTDCRICSFPNELRTWIDRDRNKNQKVFYNSEGKEIRSIDYSKSIPGNSKYRAKEDKRREEQRAKQEKQRKVDKRREEQSVKQEKQRIEKERKLIHSVQDSLKELGYYQGLSDGILGPNTSDAIKKFQEENNIKSDGKANSSLLSKIKRVIEKNERDRIALIKSIQRILAQIGYSIDKKPGVLGIETKTAIKAFQQEKNLKKDGLPSESLLVLLQRELKQNPPKINYAKFVITKTGSGLKINDQGYIITNHHVVKKCKHLTINRRTPLVIERSDALNDISLLKSVSVNKNIKSLSFSKLDPELGEKVFVAGYPFNYLLGEINFTSGNVSSEVGLGQNVSQFQLTAPIQPGNSGGPIFNEFGNVLGIAVQRLDSDYVKELTGSIPQNINFGIKQSVLRKLLNQAEVNFSVGNQIFNTSQKKIANLAKKGTVLISCWE